MTSISGHFSPRLVYYSNMFYDESILSPHKNFLLILKVNFQTRVSAVDEKGIAIVFMYNTRFQQILEFPIFSQWQ